MQKSYSKISLADHSQNNDSVTTFDGSESQLSCTHIQPLTMNFFEKEKAFALVQCKLGYLKSEKDNSNCITPSVTSFKSKEMSKKMQNSLIIKILTYAGYR